MARTLKLRVVGTLDGRPLQGLPLNREFTVSDRSRAFVWRKFWHLGALGPEPLMPEEPEFAFPAIGALALRAARAVKLWLNGQTDEGVALGAGGLCVILGTELVKAEGEQHHAALVNEDEDNPVEVRGFVGEQAAVEAE